MTDAFMKDYAEYYDLIYKDKNYNRECDYLEQIWSKFSREKPTKVLDVGCGTGGHSIPLSERGYKVTGVDLSEAMINIAKEKAASKQLDIKFYVYAMQEMDLQKKYDTVICMFNALNHVVGADLIKKTLSKIHDLLVDGGLLLFDYRNGIPSIRSFSPTRAKWIENGNYKILRISETKLDAIKQLFHTYYTVLIIDEDNVVKKFFDKHIVQFFFPLEIEEYLKTTGFEILNTSPFLSIDEPASEDDWNVMVVARSI